MKSWQHMQKAIHYMFQDILEKRKGIAEQETFETEDKTK